MARKEWYLYVQSAQRLLRLNLSDLCGESGSSSRPDFEVAYDYSNSDGKVPIGMGCMVVDSKIYMVGGEYTNEGSMLLEQDDKKWINSDNVYCFDPTKSEDRLVLVREGSFPRLNAPKTCPLVVTLEGKFYLLFTRPLLDGLTGTVAIFEGFDPTLPIPSWKILPDYPPYKLLDDPSYTPTYPPSADDYFAWGHKFVSAPPDYFIFDAKDEKWTNGHWLLRKFADKSAPYPHGVAVEFKGILFAVSNDINAVVAYDLDAGGHLNAHWVLDELSEVFRGPPSLYPSEGFLTDLGGGRMCVLFNGLEGIRWTIRVEVFQVSITTVGDRPVVHRGTLHSYHLGSWHDYNPLIYSVFVCDHSNKSDNEADARLMQVPDHIVVKT